MTSLTSYEDGLAVLRRAWSNISITHGDTQGVMFGLRNLRYDAARFEELISALRLMPRSEQSPSLEIIQLVWRMPTHMLMYRQHFEGRIDMAQYDRHLYDVLIEATKIIGVRLDEASA